LKVIYSNKMNRRKFLKKTLEGIVIAGGICCILLISGCGKDPVAPEPESISGSQSWSIGDAYDFSSQKLYGEQYDKGDVYLAKNQIPEYDTSIHKSNAIAIYDAGTDTLVDPRKVPYDTKVSSIILLSWGPLEYKHNITICIKTEEGYYAKMIYPTIPVSPFLFNWYLYLEK